MGGALAPKRGRLLAAPFGCPRGLGGGGRRRALPDRLRWLLGDKGFEVDLSYREVLLKRRAIVLDKRRDNHQESQGSPLVHFD